jgi:hypothetical protein
VGDHVADPTQAVPGSRGNYMLYVRTTRRAFLGALGVTALFTPRVVIGLVEAFRSSTTDGWADVLSGVYVLGSGAILIVAVFLGCWIPALIRISILRRRLPDASFFLLRAIPNFWDRLPVVDPSRVAGGRIPNATISLDRDGATVWRGVWRPRVAAVLPLQQLVSIETDRPTGTPFKRRITVLTFHLGLVTEELPIAFRTVASLGLLRVSPKTESQIVSQLGAFQ